MYRIFFLLFSFAGSLWATGQNYTELSNKARQLYNEGKYEEAIPIAIKAKDTAQKEFGDTSGWYATSLNDLALLYQRVNNYQDAEKLFKQASDIYKNLLGEEKPEYVTSLNNLAYLYKDMGYFDAAELLFQQALVIIKKILGEEHLEYTKARSRLTTLYQKMYESLTNKARQLYNEGKYEEAILIAKIAKDTAQKKFGDTSLWYATSVNNLALLYEAIENYADAETFFIQASDIYKEILGEESNDYATCLNNLAHLYNKMGYLYNDIGYFDTAELLFQQLLSFRKKKLGTEHPEYIISLSTLDSFYQNLKEFAGQLNDLAGSYVDSGYYAGADTLFKKSLAIYKKLYGEEHIDYGRGLQNLGYLYYQLGNYAAAEPLYTKALPIIKKELGEKDIHYAGILNNVASLYTAMGNYIRAEALFKEALAVSEESNGESALYDRSAQYAMNLNNLGLLYDITGNYVAAELLYKRALAIRKKIFTEESSYYSVTLNNLAFLYFMIGDYAAAESMYKQASSIWKKLLGEENTHYATSLNNLAQLYTQKGDYTTVEQLYQKALSITKKVLGDRHPSYYNTLVNIASLYNNIGNYVLGERCLIQASNLVFNHIENNFTNLSESEKLDLWKREEINFQIAPSLLFTHHNSSDSFLQQTCTQQLKLKGFVLEDGAKILRQARKNGNAQFQQLLNEWQHNKAILAKQYSLPIAKRIPHLDSLEAQTNEQEKQINSQSGIFRTSQASQQIGFNEVRQQLKQDEAAIEFIRFNYYRKGWTDSILYSAFIILPNDTIPHFITLCEEKQLAGLLESKSNSSGEYVKQLYRGATISNKQMDGKKGDSLYKLVWKPLLPWLKEVKKISIAPAGLLNRVAFKALPVDSSTYLINKYQLRQYSSVRQIAEQKIIVSNTDATTGVILYGGIEFNSTDTTSSNVTVSNSLPDDVKRSIRSGSWNALPGTLQEVNNISQLFKTNKKTTQVITGTAATEESLKQLSGHSPTILHLATHGFSLPDAEQKRKDNLNNNDNQFTLADNSLLRSGIIMAGANRVWGGAAPVAGKEDGIVTAYEISNLDLSNTELVVLSACETALGDIKGTEGVFGLQRAFKLAGVQNMILSLWQVPDAETAELMNPLYTNKLKGMSNYEAFNEAQDIMRKKYPPYSWAAFVLIE